MENDCIVNLRFGRLLDESESGTFKTAKVIFRPWALSQKSSKAIKLFPFRPAAAPMSAACPMRREKGGAEVFFDERGARRVFLGAVCQLVRRKIDSGAVTLIRPPISGLGSQVNKLERVQIAPSSPGSGIDVGSAVALEIRRGLRDISREANMAHIRQARFR